MTTYLGETIQPHEANSEEKALLREYLSIKDSLTACYERMEELSKKLPKGVPLVMKNNGEYRTYIMDTPKGHFVQYKSHTLTMDTKTTKKDMQELNLDI